MNGELLGAMGSNAAGDPLGDHAEHPRLDPHSFLQGINCPDGLTFPTVIWKTSAGKF